MNILNNKAVMNIEKCQPKRGPAAPVNSPPPPRIFLEHAGMVKKTLLLCLLFLLCIIALPVQSQTPAPTVPARLDNPTAADLADTCGLPATYARFTSAASTTTFNMTADCAYHTWSSQATSAILYFESGTFIINGNGHSISGPPHIYLIYVEGSNTTVTLNNVIIQNHAGNFDTIDVRAGATFNGNNIIFRNNIGTEILWVTGANSRAVLRNVQFLNNRQQTRTGRSGLIAINAGAAITITNGIFRANTLSTGETAVITAVANGASVTLNGCMTFENNVQADGSTAADDSGALTGVGAPATVTDSSTGRCPGNFSYWLALTPQKKSKKTPRPSPTARPLATTCIDLHQATGIVVHATYGLASGVQCQRLDGGGIGVQAIVDGGFIDAVDIWGYAEQGVEVCFPQAGELLFLDARMMPRAAAPLAATVVNGMTCGAIETPGSIVLMPPG